MNQELKTMEKVREVNKGFPFTPPIKQFKEQGGKVVATECSYLPEEIIWAADILPVRLTGGDKQIELEDANSYIYINTCSYCRTRLQLALAGKFDFLDG